MLVWVGLGWFGFRAGVALGGGWCGVIQRGVWRWLLFVSWKLKLLCLVWIGFCCVLDRQEMR